MAVESEPVTVAHVITDLEPGGAGTMPSRLVTHPAGKGLMQHEVVSVLGEGTLGAAIRGFGRARPRPWPAQPRALPRGVLRQASLVRRPAPTRS